MYIPRHLMYTPTMERYFERCDKENDCLLWTGWLHRDYAVVEVSGKRKRLHRLVYEFYNGDIGAGLVIDHLCRKKSCINPNHLEAVTNRENLDRGTHKNRDKIFCDSGHPFNEENTYRRPNGKRSCKACHRIADNAYKRRIRAKLKGEK